MPSLISPASWPSMYSLQYTKQHKGTFFNKELSAPLCARSKPSFNHGSSRCATQLKKSGCPNPSRCLAVVLLLTQMPLQPLHLRCGEATNQEPPWHHMEYKSGHAQSPPATSPEALASLGLRGEGSHVPATVQQRAWQGAQPAERHAAICGQGSGWGS